MDDSDDELSWQIPKAKKKASNKPAWTVAPNKNTAKWTSPTPSTPKAKPPQKKPNVPPKQSKNRYAMPGSFSAGLMGMESSEAGSSDSAEPETAELDLTPEKPPQSSGDRAQDDDSDVDKADKGDDDLDTAIAAFSKITITGPKTPSKDSTLRRSSAPTLSKKPESDEEEEKEPSRDATSVFGNIVVTGSQHSAKTSGDQNTTSIKPANAVAGLRVKTWTAGSKYYAEIDLPFSWELLIKSLRERGLTINGGILAQRTKTRIKIADNQIQRQLKVAGDTEQSVANVLKEVNKLLSLEESWAGPKPVTQTPILADLAKPNQNPTVHPKDKPAHVLPWPFPEQSRSRSKDASRSSSRGSRHVSESRQRPIVPQAQSQTGQQMIHRDARPRPPSQLQYPSPRQSQSNPRQTNLPRGGRVDATPTRRQDFRDERPRNTSSTFNKPKPQFWNHDDLFAKSKKTTAVKRIGEMALKDREAYLHTLRTVPMPQDTELVYKGVAWPDTLSIDRLGSDSAKDELSDLDRLRAELDCHVGLLSKGYQAFLGDEDELVNMSDVKVRGALVVAGHEEDNVMIAFERLKLFRGQCLLETQESDHRILVRALSGSCPTADQIVRVTQEAPQLFNRPTALNETAHFQSSSKRTLLLIKPNLFRLPDDDDDAAVSQLKRDCTRYIGAFGQEQLDHLSTYCGKIEISVTIGSVSFPAGFKKNVSSTLIEFAKQAREAAPCSARLCRVSTSDRLYARLMKAGHLLTDLSSFDEQSVEVQPADLSKIEPHLAIEVFCVNGQPDISFQAQYKIGQGGQCHETSWRFAGAGKRSSSAIVTTLENGLSWSLSFEHQRFKYKSPPKTSEQMKAHVEYVGHDVHVYDAPDLEKLFKIHTSHRGPFIQKVIWQFRLLKLEDYIVELTRYDLFESPSPQRPNDVPNTSVQCEWGLSIRRARWTQELAQNQVSPIGEPAGWEPNLDTFFPAARNSPEKKQNGAGMRDLINAVNELVDFLNKKDSGK